MNGLAVYMGGSNPRPAGQSPTPLLDSEIHAPCPRVAFLGASVSLWFGKVVD